MQNTWTRGRVVTPRIAALSALAIVVVVATVLVISGLASSWLTTANGSRTFDGQRSPETVAFASNGGQVLQLARGTVSDVVLRQVDVDPSNPSNGHSTFHFVSLATLQEVDVIVPSPTAPLSQWEVRRPPPSPLTHDAHPGMDLSVLRVAPDQAVRAMTAYRSGCAPRSLTLFGEREALTWYVSCTLPDGRVPSDTVDGRTGTFQPSAAPPASPPLTAVPST